MKIFSLTSNRFRYKIVNSGESSTFKCRELLWGINPCTSASDAQLNNNSDFE